MNWEEMPPRLLYVCIYLYFYSYIYICRGNPIRINMRGFGGGGCEGTEVTSGGLVSRLSREHIAHLPFRMEFVGE